MQFYYRIMHPKDADDLDADGMADSVDSDQTVLGLRCLPITVCAQT